MSEGDARLPDNGIPALITLDYARLHQRSSTRDDDDLMAKAQLATRIVMKHCKLPWIPDAWVVPTQSPMPMDISVMESPPVWVRVPANIQAAIILVMAELFLNREASTANVLSDTVIDLLSEFRGPSFA